MISQESKQDKGLAIVVAENNEQGENFIKTTLGFWDPLNKFKVHAEDANIDSLLVTEKGIYYASDFSYLIYKDGKGEIIDDNGARGLAYCWSDFFEHKNEVFCVRVSLLDEEYDLVQLTRNSIPIFKETDLGTVLGTKISLERLTNTPDRVYGSFSDGTIGIIHLDVIDGRFKESKPRELITKRGKNPNFICHNRKMYDFSDSKLYETDENKLVFEASSPIIAAQSLDTIFCLTENGEIWDTKKRKMLLRSPGAKALASFRGKLLYHNCSSLREFPENNELFNITTYNLKGKISIVTPISGEWYEKINLRNQNDKI